MTSQLNVDTIVDKAGSGGTNVKVANTSTYVSDGGSVTQNTVQGLTKVWCKFNGTSTLAINDSLNVSSVTDVGTGNYSPQFSNNMSSEHFCAHATKRMVNLQILEHKFKYQLILLVLTIYKCMKVTIRQTHQQLVIL